MELNTTIDIKTEPDEVYTVPKMHVDVLKGRKIPLLLDGKFFVIEQAQEAEKSKVKIEARCTKCNKILSGLLESTTNFLCHLKLLNKMATRRVLTIKEKKNIISELEKGRSNTEICREYNLSRSTVSNIKINKEKFKGMRNLNASKIRNPIRTDVDSALLEWFSYQKSEHVTIRGEALRLKAEELGKLTDEGFTCSRGWVDRFKRRHNIISGMHGDSASTSEKNTKNHAETLKAYEEYKLTESIKKKYNRQSTSTMDLNTDELILAKKRKTSQQSLPVLLANKPTPSQATADKLISEFIVQSMLPTSLTESQAFTDLVAGLSNLNSPVNTLSKNELCKNIFEDYCASINVVKNKLNEAEFVSTTADVLSVGTSFYLGMTAHWVNNKLQRESAAIAFKRIEDDAPIEKVIEMIFEIHQNFNLPLSKLVKTVIDNDSSVAQAFTSYISAKTTSTGKLNEDLPEEYVTSNEDKENVSQIRNMVYDRLETYIDCSILPKQERSFSHILSMIITNDTHEAYNDKIYRGAYESAFSKCNNLWNTTSKSYKPAEMYLEITKKNLTSPCRFYDNTYDCILDILSVKNSLNDACTKLNIIHFEENDFEFLKEYSECIQPIIVTLTTMRSEIDYGFYGELLPQLFRTHDLLKKNQANNFTYCSTFNNALLENFERRFDKYLLLDYSVIEAMLATVSHPFFKLRWAPKHFKNFIRETFLNELMSMQESSTLQDQQDNLKCPEKIQQAQKNAYYNFDSSDNEEDSKTNLNINMQGVQFELESIRYLQDPDTSIQSLNKYPLIMKLFKKYNTPLISSVPVEKLLCFEELFNIRQRKYLFEEQLLLKANFNHLPNM